MTNDGILVLECLFGNVWSLFNSWYIPGTKVTPASFLMFLAFAGFVLRWLSRLFDVQLGAGAVVDKATETDIVPSRSAGAFDIKSFKR